MGRRTLKFIAENNRQIAGGIERRCGKCRGWRELPRFKITHGMRSYICLECEATRQRLRYAENGKPGRRSASGKKRVDALRRGAPRFDDARVDVLGLMNFATGPTPAQLLQRKAA